MCGGDGTVNMAAAVAAPGTACRSPCSPAARSTTSRTTSASRPCTTPARPWPPARRSAWTWAASAGPQGPGGAHGYFLNTFSLGVYPELVRTRERWAPRIGGWPAGVLAACASLRGDRPLAAEVEGRRRPLWLLFAGNGLYQRVGPAPGRRHDLADGLLDVRVVHGGRPPGLRLLAAALAGPLTRSPVHAAVRRRRVRLAGLTPGTPLAYDGEVAHSGRELLIEKLPEALTVYRPMPV